jgi:hypothetical protein
VIERGWEATQSGVRAATSERVLLPMTYYINNVRGMALKDVGLLEVWQPAVILTGFALLLVTISLKRFF